MINENNPLKHEQSQSDNSNTNKSSYQKLKQMKQFMINFLEQTEKQHTKKISQLTLEIQELKKQKQRAEKKKQFYQEEIKKYKLNQKEMMEKIEEMKMQNPSESFLESNSMGDQYIMQQLKQAPLRIIKFLKNMQAQKVSIPNEYSGNMTCVLLSPDNVSLDKHEKVNWEFVKRYFKKHKNQIQLLLLHNPQNN